MARGTARAAARRPSERGPLPRARDRFRELDQYRVDREWQRYEGNALRDLFRELRLRFLARHPPTVPGPVLEVGPGPGRFSASLGGPENPRLLLDLSVRALRVARGHLSGRSEREFGASGFVRGDALRPPVRRGAFAQVVLLGNALGFAEGRSEELLDRCLELIAPQGGLILEFVAGAGEFSSYGRRIPPGALRRALAAPPRVLLGRFLREGFVPIVRPARAGHPFRRQAPARVAERLAAAGLRVEELCAVAPALGGLPDRLEAIRSDPRAWDHLLEIEESIGQQSERLRPAAAVLLAARRESGPGSAVSKS
jgi:SAM-dependent methyltransferase